MSNHILAYYLALGSSLAFSGASLIFAEYARRVSPVWMNVFKALVAWICFALAILLAGTWTDLQVRPALALFTSGVIGLAIGDVFLLTAYARMGAARTLILFGFQPLFIAVEAHFLFAQDMSWTIALAVLFFMCCLFTFSLEKFKQDGHWEIYGLVAALIAVTLDNLGVILSRWAFDQTEGLNAFQANLVRCTGAMAFFFLFGSVRKIHLRSGWKGLSRRDRVWVTAAAFTGCFFSLVLYLTAVKIGHLASITALVVAGPILASVLECLYYRKRPSPYLLVALLLFLAGFGALTLL